MKNNSPKKPVVSTAQMGEESTYDPRLDAYSGKVLFPAKLAEAKKIFALWDFKSFREEYEKTHGK